MLAIKSQQKIVQRILTTKTGEQVRAMFLVVESDGEFKVHLLSVSPISSQKAISCKLSATSFSHCLSGNSLKSPAIISYKKAFYNAVSPFFNTLEFFVSQPTRAPSR
ncbi:MAG: hypothetical protein V4467_00145 [Patescibacteria group bacterium]